MDRMDSESIVSPLASVAWLGAVWFIGALLLWWGDRMGVRDPTCASYGTICPGDLRFMFGWLTAEVLGLGVVLHIWTPAPLWRRTRGVWQTVLVLVVVSYPVTMHQGAVQTMHLRWLAILGIAAYVISRRYRPTATAA